MSRGYKSVNNRLEVVKHMMAFLRCIELINIIETL